MSDVVASRCIIDQPTREAKCIPYDGFRGSFKVVDYGNPKLSFYGYIGIVAHSKTELVEVIEFDNLKDFQILNKEPGTSEISVKLH